MKKLIAVLLLLAMCLSLFAGCGNDDPPVTNTQQEPPVSDTAPDTGSVGDEVDPDAVKSAIAYVKALYKNVAELTPQDYQRVGTVPVGAVKFDVEWTVDVGEDVVKIVRGDDGMVTIDVNEECEEETPYVLTATVTDAAGNSESLSWNHIVPAKMDSLDILKAAYALAPGEELGYTVTLTGVIVAVNTPYDPGYGNVTVTIVVDGHEDMPIMCYCVLDAVVKGDYVAPEAPSSMTQIVDEAYALAKNDSLPYTATLTGVITKVKDAYNSQYGNVTVEIVVAGRESKPILCYRIKGDGADSITIGDTITVTGVITHYYSSESDYSVIEFVTGSKLDAVVKGDYVAPVAPSSVEQILNEAFALPVGESLAYECTLSGVITDFYYSYNPAYTTIAAYITVNGRELLCFSMHGDGIDKVAVGDTITVTGYIKNYNGTIEFGSCSLDSYVKGTGTVPEPDEPDIPDVPALDYVVNPEVGVPYRFVIAQGTVGSVIYFNGGIDGNFLTTTTDPAEAVDVYLESAGNGYRLYFMDGETKTYIDIQDRGEGKAKIALTAEPTAVAALNTDIAGYGILLVTIGENTFFMGTYSNYQTFSASSTYYVTGDKASTVGVTQFVGGFIVPGTEPDAPGCTIVPREDGKPVCDASKCVYCTLCAKKCPQSALEVDRAAKTWKCDYEACVACGVCATVCPKKAIEM